MKNRDFELVNISNLDIENKDAFEYLSREETLKLLNISDKTFNKNYKPKLKDVIRDKRDNNSIYYNKDEVLKLKVLEDENKEVKNLENKGTKIANSFSPTEINVATDKMLDNIDFSKKENVMGFLENFSNLYMKVVDKAFASKDLENKSLINENERLKTKLGINENYYSVKRVSMINKKSQKDYNWRALKNKSFELGLEIKDEQDSNYGTVKSYHIRVWKEVYPNEKY